MNSRRRLAIALGVILPNAPIVSAQPGAAHAATWSSIATSPYSDRDHIRAWNQGKEALQRALKPGQSKESFRQTLRNMGYAVTAVNFDTPDYVEWEIVKGNYTYELRMDFDDGKSSEVNVTPNVWRAGTTQRALLGRKVAENGPGDARFRDREYEADWTQGEQALRRALEPGQSKNFYRDELKKLGYLITATNYDQPGYVEWEIVKDNQSYEIQIDFAGAKGSRVRIERNMWRADATERALESSPATK